MYKTKLKELKFRTLKHVRLTTAIITRSSHSLNVCAKNISLAYLVYEHASLRYVVQMALIGAR